MHRLKIFAGILMLALVAPIGAEAQADFTRYVALGDSLTAGFSSGALVRTFQVNSYPALINRQATGNAGAFVQPLVSEPGIGGTPGAGILELRSLIPSPVIAPRPGQGTLTNPLITRPYNNLGVPGARVRDTLGTTSGGLHDLVLQQFSPVLAGRNALQQMAQLQPTFVTLWIGNNDALAAATSGRVIEDVTLTSVARFETEYRAVAAAVAATGAEFAVANIPSVTSIPFVTTLPRTFTANGQQIPLNGPNGPLGAGDFVLLTATAELSVGGGRPGLAPLSDGVVLSASEVATINARVSEYNRIIRTVAQERGAAFVDANAVLTEASTRGISVGGLTFSSGFLTGGIFSYDGVHPNAFGYAYIANRFIQAINDQFDEDIPPVNLFPFIFGGATGTSVASSALTQPATSFAQPFVFSREAKNSLLKSLGVPQWVIDGDQKPPTRKPRRPRG